MSDLELRIDDAPVTPSSDLRIDWIEPGTGLARLDDGRGPRLVAIEGRGTDWTVTLNGRRIAVTARTWREQMLAAAERETAARGGPVDVKATLPGLVVAVAVAEGDVVAAGHGLLTIEAMKMQNEVRAPRAGRVARLSVAAGSTVATGALLVRIDD